MQYLLILVVLGGIVLFWMIWADAREGMQIEKLRKEQEKKHQEHDEWLRLKWSQQRGPEVPRKYVERAVWKDPSLELAKYPEPEHEPDPYTGTPYKDTLYESQRRQMAVAKRSKSNPTVDGRSHREL